jgi:hypothetical protein
MLTLWQWLSVRPFVCRLGLKILILFFVFLAMTFPNPFLTIKQIEAYRDIESLFVMDFPELAAINVSIDSLLPENYTFEDEYKTIIRFVYNHIRYQYDWDNWINSEYWPPADQVWRRGREDCDGRAILAVVIFRSRGYADATVVGSMTHLWIKVGDQELMGAQPEKIMEMQDGQKRMRMPKLSYVLKAAAQQLDSYPIFRMIVILLCFVLLSYHPARNIKLLLGLSLLSLIGFVLLLDWACSVSFYDEMKINANLLFGSLFLMAALLTSLFSQRLVKSTK